MPSAAQTLGLQGGQLLTHAEDGGGTIKRVAAEGALEGKIVGIYFSAHWCPPCKAFTPVLVSAYRALQQKQKDFEVVFISSDRDAAQFQEYFKNMPWLAVAYEDHALRQQLGRQFNVAGIPRLIILGPDGQVVASDARAAVMSDPRGDKFPWQGASGGMQSLLGFLLNPQGLLLLFLIMYYISQWISKSFAS